MDADKFKAIIGLAIDRAATDFIKEVVDESMLMKNFSYSYEILVKREHVSLEVCYNSQEVFKTTYFYSLQGSEDGSIEISLSDSNDEIFLTMDFNADYDFDKLIGEYNS